MAYPTVTSSVTGVGTTKPIEFRSPGDNFRMLIMCVVSGTVGYDLEYTIDPLKQEWVAIGTTGRASTSADSFYFPADIRVNVTSGTGTVKLVIMYTGS